MNKVFTAVIKQHEDMNAAFVEVPFDVQEVFGAKRVKVAAVFDDVPYRGSIVNMGGSYVIGMTQDIRKRINKSFGDTVSVTVEKDETERTVELPEDFAEQLKNNLQAQSRYDALAFTHKKKYVDWIISSKKAETREKRIGQAIAMLLDENKK